ncbi:RNA polymerase sigma-70 factor [Halosquirtibacter laminarini]|uniref:RNA polymerase sigma-70 factor n=1 Tax=Halosquirtibacter laminarini TaxID=3374600 RepID=A0AC61NIZ9_9BACT|nr:RNA polymerase sigma-70 factor [Prolixibacteraceae bacterium]
MINQPIKTDNLFHNISVKDDMESFKVLFSEFYPVLCLYCKRFIKDKETCEDIVQGVFTSIWEQRKYINITTSIRSYLLTSARNGCLNYLKRASRTEHFEQQILENSQLYANSSEDLISISELEQMLKDALEKLPESYRKVFEMSRIQKKKNKEIAQEIGVSEKTVERRKKFVTDHLKKNFKDYYSIILLLYIMKY